MTIAWDKPWDLARELHKRGMGVKEIAKMLNAPPRIVWQWAVPRPCPSRPLVEQVAMLRQMGVSWKQAAAMLGHRSESALRSAIGDTRTKLETSRAWHARYREELRMLRKEIGRA